MRNHPDAMFLDTVCVDEQPGRDLRHDHDASAAGRDAPDHHAGEWIRAGMQRVECGDERLFAAIDKIEDLAAPFPRVEPEFVLQADHVAGAVIGDIRCETVGMRAVVADDVNHPRICVGDCTDLFDGGHRGNGLAGGEIDCISSVFRERRQTARFGRIGRDKEWAHNRFHRSPPGRDDWTVGLAGLSSQQFSKMSARHADIECHEQHFAT